MQIQIRNPGKKIGGDIKMIINTIFALNIVYYFFLESEREKDGLKNECNYIHFIANHPILYIKSYINFIPK